VLRRIGDPILQLITRRPFLERGNQIVNYFPTKARKPNKARAMGIHFTGAKCSQI
jgi:hypothetical protein